MMQSYFLKVTSLDKNVLRWFYWNYFKQYYRESFSKWFRPSWRTHPVLKMFFQSIFLFRKPILWVFHDLFFIHLIIGVFIEFAHQDLIEFSFSLIPLHLIFEFSLLIFHFFLIILIFPIPFFGLFYFLFQ